MQNAQEVYNSTISQLSSSEQLELASLILEKLAQSERESEERPARRSIREILADCPGGRIFKTAAEVDEYLRQERDSWER